MKKILSLILIFQLIVFPLPSLAEDSSLPTPPVTTSSPEDEEELLDSQATTYADETRVGGADPDWSGDYWLKQVLQIGAACVGSSIMLACKHAVDSPSLWAFEIAAIVQIIQEIIFSGDIQKDLEADHEDLKMNQEKLKNLKEKNNLQKSVFEKMRTKETALKKSAEKRRNWMYAISIMYGAAAASSGLEMFFQLYKWADGHSALCFPPPPAPPTPPGTPPVPTTPAEAVSIGNLIAITSAWAAASFISSGNQLVGGNSNEFLTAGLSTASVIMLALFPKINRFVLGAVDQVILRTITFSAFSLMTWWIAEGYDDIMDAADENLNKIQTVINTFPPEEVPGPNNNGGTLGGNPEQWSGGGGGGGYNKNDRTSGGSSGSRLCASRGVSGEISVGADCANPIKISKPDLSEFNDLPILKDAMTNAGQIANSLVQGQSGASLDGRLAELKSMAAGMRKLQKNVEKKINNYLKKKNKPTVDFNAEKNKMLSSLKQTYIDAGKSSGGFPVGPNTANILDNSKNQKDKNDSTSKFISGGSNVVVGGKSAAGVSPKPVESFEQESLTSGLEGNYGQKNSAKSLNKFNIDSGDISQNKDVSLFSIISNRYVRSYDRVMNKKN